jgi:hypothetical protein
VNRRLLAVLAGLATVALSSCATFNRNQVAAQVGDQSLSVTEAATLSDGTDGAAYRNVLTEWVTLQSLGGDTAATPRSGAELSVAVDAAYTELASQRPEIGEQLYSKGTDGSPAICLALLPVASVEIAQQVLTSLNAGGDFSTLVSQYSVVPELAATGGVPTSAADGCFPIDSLTQQAPEVVDALKGAVPGTTVGPILSGNVQLLVRLRTFDELQTATRQQFAAQAIRTEPPVDLFDVPVFIDPRYGRWDPATASVVPLSS